METERFFMEEHRLLEMFGYCFNYFNIEDLAKIVSLSKRFMSALCQNSGIFISLIKKFYLSQNHVHPKLRRYFQIILTKRPKIKELNLSEIAKQIYFLSLYRIDMSRNLIRDVYCLKNPKKILETGGRFLKRCVSSEQFQNSLIERKHGGDGWKPGKELIPEFRKRFLTTSYGMCEISYKAFFQQFPPAFLDDFKNGRTVLKVGCFISRAQVCEASGGCLFQIFDSAHHLLFDIKQHKRSNEIPTSSDSVFVYQELSFIIPFKDLLPTIDLSSCFMKFIIYGKDERFWAGHYGSRFIAMYIRGDYSENPLNQLLNS